MSKLIKYKGFKNYFPILSRLKSDSKNFTVSKTNSTNIIDVMNFEGKKEITYFFSDEFTPMHLLPMMKSIKNEVELNSSKVNEAEFSSSPFDIQYFEFKPSINELVNEHGCTYEFKNVYEADITGAYYKAALLLNFISKDTYTNCMKLDKKHRLKVLGSIATTKSIYRYINGRLANTPLIKQSDIHRKAWFKICSYVNNAMQHLKAELGDNFIFYWVDGIYFTNLIDENDSFRSKNKREVQEMFLRLTEHYKFDWKIKKLKKIEVVNTNNIVQVIVHDKKEKKPFSVPKKKVIYYGFGNKKEFYKI